MSQSPKDEQAETAVKLAILELFGAAAIERIAS